MQDVLRVVRGARAGDRFIERERDRKQEEQQEIPVGQDQTQLLQQRDGLSAALTGGQVHALVAVFEAEP